MSWTLDDAIKLIREHQSEVNSVNYYLALAGGVLNNGHSDKDLDILVVPMIVSARPVNIYRKLTELFGPLSDSGVAAAVDVFVANADERGPIDFIIVRHKFPLSI